MRVSIFLTIATFMLVSACANESVGEQNQALQAADPPAELEAQIVEQALEQATEILRSPAGEAILAGQPIPTSNMPPAAPCTIAWQEYEQAVMANAVSTDLNEDQHRAACESMPETLRACLTAGYAHNNAERCVGQAQQLHPELRGEFAGLLPNHAPLAGSLRLPADAPTAE